MRVFKMGLHDFLADKRPYQQNGIELVYDDETTDVLITCMLPNEDNRFAIPLINLTVSFDNLDDFIHEFMITQIFDLNEINPESMYRRFLVGRATLIFYLDDDMTFQLKYKWEKTTFFLQIQILRTRVRSKAESTGICKYT